MFTSMLQTSETRIANSEMTFAEAFSDLDSIITEIGNFPTIDETSTPSAVGTYINGLQSYEIFGTDNALIIANQVIDIMITSIEDKQAALDPLDPNYAANYAQYESYITSIQSIQGDMVELASPIDFVDVFEDVYLIYLTAIA